MKILMLSAYILSLTFSQQNNSLLAKKAESNKSTTIQEKQKAQAKDSKLNSTEKEPSSRDEIIPSKAKPSLLNKPAQAQPKQ